MKTAIFLWLVALPLSAGTIWFDPPNPTSQTHVIAHVRAGTACPISGSDVAVHGSIVSITLHAPVACATPLPPNGFFTNVDLGVLPAGVYDVVAGPETLLIALAEGTLVVQDAAPPFRLSPNVSQSGRDNVITIKGPGVAAFCKIPPCPTPPVVMFGDKQSEFVQQIDTDTFLVTAPSHEPGIVDVTLNGSKTFRATAAFDYYGSSFDPAFFEPVLFPVLVSGPGAFGSEWRTDAILRNDNDYTFPVHSIFDFALQALPPDEERPRGHSTAFEAVSLPNGYLLNLPRESAPRVSFGLLVKDLSRQAEAFGTEIPVVREKDFFDRPFTLLNVPADSRYRVALRLYRLDGVASTHIRISQLYEQEALVDTFVSLASAGLDSAYTIAYDGDLLKTYPILAGKGPLRIDVDAGDGQHETWGFVSITNNDTQHVSVISPQ